MENKDQLQLWKNSTKAYCWGRKLKKNNQIQDDKQISFRNWKFKIKKKRKPQNKTEKKQEITKGN